MKTQMYLEPLKKQIENLLNEKGSIIVAIDGCAASGKTTAAGYLAEYFHGNVIHMDDFFLPFDMRTQERFRQPGGNIHSERFLEEVWKPLQAGVEFSYRRFDCSIGDYGESISIKPNPVTIIEGAYSMRPNFIDYDIGVFFESKQEIQYKRILKRNGPEKLEAFQTRFIPMENKYFEVFSVKNHADLLVDTSVVF